MPFLKNVPRRATSRLTKLQAPPSGPARGRGRGSRARGQRGCLSTLGLVGASGQPDGRPLVFGNSAGRVRPRDRRSASPDGRRACISLGAAWPQSTALRALDLGLLQRLPASREPRGRDPALLQVCVILSAVWAAPRDSGAQHASKPTGEARSSCVRFCLK